MHTIMNVDRNRSHALRLVAAALAIAITIGMFSAVIGLFQILALSPGELAAAERACAERIHASEREACMRQGSGARHVRMANR